MGRKLNIPKAKQIQGLRKALANRKTPRQFIPSLKKRLRKLTGAAVFLLAVLGSLPAHAQTPVSIQPIQQALAPAGTLCTGSAQTFTVNNRNQTQHYAYAVSTGVYSLGLQIFGIDSSGTTYLISDTGTQGQAGLGSDAAVLATGYFPTVEVVVTCLPTSGSFLLNYSGGQAISNQVIGAYQLAQLDKVIAANGPAGTTLTSPVAQTPLGNSLGTISFAYVGASGPSGSTLVVECSPSTAVNPTTFTFTPATATGAQFFNVPSFPCLNVTIEYSSGGSSTTVFTMDYTFLPAGFSLPNNYQHLASTTATELKPGPGTVHSIVVGTPAAGTITLFDLVPGSCTGTPATNVVSIITSAAGFPGAAEIYDVLFKNGICVKASSASIDFTVAYQ
jgi:hypothetical protein